MFDKTQIFVLLFFRLGQQTEEIAITTANEQTNMSNYNQRPGYYPPPYAYNYTPYAQPPYPPAVPYGMPTATPHPMGNPQQTMVVTPQPMVTPIPMVTPAPMPTGKPVPNFSYYSPHAAVEPQQPYMTASPPVYAQIPYSHTRMATPSPYAYPPTPGYNSNYNTTSMIARPPPPRPASLYPQLGQLHTYPVAVKAPTNNVGQAVNAQKTQTVVRTEPTRDSVESNSSRKSSEVSKITRARWSSNLFFYTSC